MCSSYKLQVAYVYTQQLWSLGPGSVCLKARTRTMTRPSSNACICSVTTATVREVSRCLALDWRVTGGLLDRSAEGVCKLSCDLAPPLPLVHDVGIIGSLGSLIASSRVLAGDKSAVAHHVRPEVVGLPVLLCAHVHGPPLLQLRLQQVGALCVVLSGHVGPGAVAGAEASGAAVRRTTRVAQGAIVARAQHLLLVIREACHELAAHEVLAISQAHISEGHGTMAHSGHHLVRLPHVGGDPL
mmetsp:Transcript_17301/g.37334  ORF Transcript_17301/g.37334 Transcript_17301/m.37334 type:complete len:242 (+) Transcript_17301:509-1234(+)